MDPEYASLIRILRTQLTAVNQQFVHILALRQWGLSDTADRILEVDMVDFPVAMKIMDYLIAAGAPLTLRSEGFTPGASEAGILSAEQDIERRLFSELTEARVASRVAFKLISTAMAPRKAYADWLAGRLSSLERTERPTHPSVGDLAELFACLIIMIEQAMTHAFVHWHRGKKADADTAWATSGAAMMQATAIVRRLASLQAVPAPRSSMSIRISGNPDTAIGLDRELAKSFADCAARAAALDIGQVGDVCSEVADYASSLSAWEPGQEHPAKEINPPAFGSFEATLRKFVWPS